MKLIETPVFKKQIDRLLDEQTYTQFKKYLVRNLLKGKLIRGGGGIRKIRWGKKNSGKSGGIRIIYFIKREAKIYLLFAYAKGEADNLTQKQTNMLAEFVKKELL
ncbi:MAG: type II toxin-antitoxin system RelE/ParE family toxin [Treponema sp.]